jgi:hypothetical protein
MKYRKLDANGDYTFGQQNGNFLTNIPAAVAQAVQTRLGLIQGEWFLDTTAGTPYNTEILGMGTVPLFDAAIQDVIVNTPGVNTIVDYASGVNPVNRQAAIACTIDTIYGITTVTQPL